MDKASLVDYELRTIDLVLSLVLIVILLPAILATAILVYFSISPPVLYKQLRPGRYGKPFVLFKFRTMTNDKDVKGLYLPDSQRLLPVGKLIRKFSLDELPQLFNVLKGEMSLVGPRPLLMEYLTLYNKDQIRRHEVRPGITGLAQVNGRNALSWADKFRYDVSYVDNRSLKLYFQILFKTIKKVFFPEGITSPNSVSMEKFTGNSNEAENYDK